MGRKLSKPSLKNYLSTGKVLIEESQEACDVSKIAVNKESADEKIINTDKLLGLFSLDDFNTWEPIIRAGAQIIREKTDLVLLRDFFRTMDRSRMTLYILE
ncbi:MAG: hypothetical protein FWE49_02090, partial [Synergistaceae bacterium]|nr:hypothetical protein [Synergistaceae bacterium]